MSLELGDKKKDFFLLFLTRGLRMFSYGMIAIVMIKNLQLKNFTGQQIGIIQSAVIFGDIIISLILTTKADIFGRKKTLMIGALLKLLTGLFYAYSNNLWILVITGIIGVISVTGTQIGPFLSIEQSTLTQLVEECTQDRSDIAKNNTIVVGYYNMAGYISEACGGAFAGFYYSYLLENSDTWNQLQITNFFFYIYALLGLAKFIGYYMIDNSRGIEATQPKQKVMLNFAGIDPKNFRKILTLSILFAFDAYGGAFVAKSYISYFFSSRYDIKFSQIGMLLFFCNIVSGISGVASAKLVQRIGAMATMVFTHLPSNLFLLAIPFTSDYFIAMLLILGRFCISQMDVPARQTYVSMIVSSSQRSAANGITNIARSVGLSVGMGINGYFIQQHPDSFMFTMPFIIAGGIKIIYDIVLGLCFLWNKKQTEQQDHVELVEIQPEKNQSSSSYVQEEDSKQGK